MNVNDCVQNLILTSECVPANITVLGFIFISTKTEMCIFYIPE